MAIWVLLVSLFVSGLSFGLVPPLFAEIEKDLLLTHTQIGIIWGAASAGTFFTALAGGMLGDRYGPRKVIAVGVFLSIAFCSLRGVLDSFWGLSLAMFLFGMALGLIIPNQSKAIGMWFGRRELGMAMGLIVVGGSGGHVISLMLGVSISAALGGWRNVMFLTGALCLAVFIMWMLLSRERPLTEEEARLAAARGSIFSGLKHVLKLRDVWFLSVVQLCVVGAAMGFMGHFPENSVARGMSPGMAGVFTGIMFLTTMVFGVVGPRLSDRVGLRRAFVWPALVVSCLLVTPLVLTSGAPLVILLIINGASVGIVMTLMRVLVIENESIGLALAGSALGLLQMANRLGSSAVPMVMGWIQDATGDFWQSYLFIGALIAVAAVLVYLLKETGIRAKKASEVAEASRGS